MEHHKDYKERLTAMFAIVAEERNQSRCGAKHSKHQLRCHFPTFELIGGGSCSCFAGGWFVDCCTIGRFVNYLVAVQYYDSVLPSVWIYAMCHNQSTLENSFHNNVYHVRGEMQIVLLRLSWTTLILSRWIEQPKKRWYWQHQHSKPKRNLVSQSTSEDLISLSTPSSQPPLLIAVAGVVKS